MWGRHTGTGVCRRKYMAVKVWRRWHSRKAFIQDSPLQFHALDRFFSHEDLVLKLIIVRFDFFDFSL
jgi:hypothetical protein